MSGTCAFLELIQLMRCVDAHFFIRPSTVFLAPPFLQKPTKFLYTASCKRLLTILLFTFLPDINGIGQGYLGFLKPSGLQKLETSRFSTTPLDIQHFSYKAKSLQGFHHFSPFFSKFLFHMYQSSTSARFCSQWLFLLLRTFSSVLLFFKHAFRLFSLKLTSSKSNLLSSLQFNSEFFSQRIAFP